MLCTWEVDVPTCHFKVHTTIWISSFRIMFKINFIQRNDVVTFLYFASLQAIFNSLLSDPKEDCMQKLDTWEVDVPTYHFKVRKYFCISYYRVMLREHYIVRNDVGYFHYFVHWSDLSSGLSSDQNEDHMQKLCPQEIYLATYQFMVQKIVCISSSRVMYRVHVRWRHGVSPFHYCSPRRVLSNSNSSDPNEYHMQNLHLGEVDITNYHFRLHKTYHHFHPLGSCLVVTISKGMWMPFSLFFSLGSWCTNTWLWGSKNYWNFTLKGHV